MDSKLKSVNRRIASAKKKLADLYDLKREIEAGSRSKAMIEKEKERLVGMHWFWVIDKKRPVEDVYHGEHRLMVNEGMTWREIEIFINRSNLSTQELAEAFECDFQDVIKIRQKGHDITRPKPNMAKIKNLAILKSDKEGKSLFSGRDQIVTAPKLVSKIKKSCSGFQHPHFLNGQS